MSLFGLLNIGKEGLLAQQRAISVTSNNISNVNTPSYTRQRAIFTPTAPTFAASGFPLSGGVSVSDVQRIADAALDAQVLREREALSFDQQRELGLARLEGIFEEIGGTGISSALGDFFQSLQDLSLNPPGVVERRSVVESALTLTEKIRNNDARAAQLQLDANDSLRQLVTEVNDLANEIAELNHEIFRAEGAGASASALRDARNEALSVLGEKIDFTSFEREDGQIALFVGGGFLLIDSGQAGSLELRTRGTGDNPEFFELYQRMGGALAGPITTQIDGGKIGALLELRDTTVPAIRDDLDEFAFTLSYRFNLLHDDGYGLVDGTQRDFFTDLTVVDGAAGQIAVDTTISGEPRHFAAAAGLDAGLGTGAPGDNLNLLNLMALETQPVVLFQIGDTPNEVAVDEGATGVTRTLGEYYAGIVGTLGSDVNSAKNAVQAQALVLTELEGRRGQISGVSIDEEVTNLLRFERAYQANARVISTVDGLLQQLLSI
jgi:flagellar hook-associated protein 1 FlgK